MGGGGGLLCAALMLHELLSIWVVFRLDSAARYGCYFGWFRLPRAHDVVFEINVDEEFMNVTIPG